MISHDASHMQLEPHCRWREVNLESAMSATKRRQGGLDNHSIKKTGEGRDGQHTMDLI